MRILVTGSAGFIGHHVSKLLLDRGDEVIGVDNLNDYYSPLLKIHRNQILSKKVNYQFINGDISNLSFIKELFESTSIQGVIHLAAQAGVRLPVCENYKYTQSNLVGFENIATSILENNIELFLYASSSSVYGDIAQSPLRESELKLSPNSYYGATKLSNEIMAKSLFKDSKTKARGLRFFSVYGPMGRPDMAYFRLLASAVSGKVFKLYGDGSIKRDFTFIGDVAGITIDLMENLKKGKENTNDIVNVGGGQPMSMSDLIDVIEKISDKKINIDYLPPNLSDSRLTSADTSLQKDLIYRIPKINLEDGITQTFTWMMQDDIILQIPRWISS